MICCGYCDADNVLLVVLYYNFEYNNQQIQKKTMHVLQRWPICMSHRQQIHRNFEENHPRYIPAKFSSKWPSCFRDFREN